MAKTSKPRLFALINPLPFGLAGRAEERYLDDTDVGRLVDTYERNKDHILGIKVLLSRRFWQSWGTPLDYLDVARTAADVTGLPIMVHGIRTDQSKWLKGITFKDMLSRQREVTSSPTASANARASSAGKRSRRFERLLVQGSSSM